MSSSLLLLALLSSAALLALLANPIGASPLLARQSENDPANQKAKKFWPSQSPDGSADGRGFYPAATRGWAQGPILMPYSDGSGFVSPFPAGLSDRWAGFLAAEQFAGGANKRTAEGHFMEPSGWLGLGEPGRLEWNFNRLR